MGRTKSIFRYEFLPNEFVNALDCVTLETQSTESGQKDFIVVGTTVNRGEDLAVRGAVSPQSVFTNPSVDMHYQ